MSQSNEKTLVIGLSVVAALLVIVVGVVIWQQTTSIPQPTISTPAAQPGQPQAQTAPQGTAGGQTGVPPASTDFDASSATEVPEGTEPDAWVSAYYQATEDGDWQAAFDHLPAASKANNTPDALKDQVSGYGIESFKITGSTVEGDRAMVTVDQVTGQYGTFENTWTFVQGENGAWLVESKKVSGMK